MNLINRILTGKAHIGSFGYHMAAKIFKVATSSLDKKRLKTQHDEALDLTILKNIHYINDKNKYHLLDIYSRKDIDDEKTIFVIHGGGLMYGDKDLNRFSNMALTRLGYKVIALSYSLAPKVNFLDQINECLKAIEFILNNKEKYKINMDNVYLFGDSAGGLLSYTICSLLSHQFDDMFTINFNLDIKGVGAISPMSKLYRCDSLAVPYKNALKKKLKKEKCYPYLCDTLKLINKTSLKPVFMTTSDKDMIRTDVLELKEVLDKNNIKNQICDFTSTTYPLEHVFPICYPDYNESKEAFKKMDEFFKSL